MDCKERRSPTPTQKGWDRLGNALTTRPPETEQPRPQPPHSHHRPRWGGCLGPPSPPAHGVACSGPPVPVPALELALALVPAPAPAPGSDPRWRSLPHGPYHLMAQHSWLPWGWGVRCDLYDQFLLFAPVVSLLGARYTPHPPKSDMWHNSKRTICIYIAIRPEAFEGGGDDSLRFGGETARWRSRRRRR